MDTDEAHKLSGFFTAGHYVQWRKNRIAKIEAIFGREFFKGKEVLELACGFGDIGKHFRELGAKVTFTDSRVEHFRPYIEKNNPGAEIYTLNQEYKWQSKKPFDVIIHFGVTYHLVNWQQDLRSAMASTGLIIYETEVTNSLNPSTVRRFKDYGYCDSASNQEGMGSRPSAACIESEILANGWTFRRYDDADLNATGHRYDWVATGASDSIPDDEYNVRSEAGQRRFWVLRGPAA